MTAPKYTPQISLGNIIQVVVLLLALSGGWFVMQTSVQNNTGVLKDHETRLRDLERTTNTQGADFRAIKETLSEVKAQQFEMNRLLRQIVQQQGR